jgi:N-acetylmuramoyl-L-alanine amidase-like protein
MDAQPMLLDKHYSSREGGRIHLLSLHTVEGEPTLRGLREIFENEEDSSHYASDKHGNIAQYVEDKFKAWTQCNYNPVCLSLEQCGFAAFTKADWFIRHRQLEAAAIFITYGHVHYGVPIRKGEVANGGIVRDGVVQHKDLGLIGCGHTDCGDGYPQDYVMLLARYYIAHKLHHAAPVTKRLKKEVNAIRQHFHIPLIK